MIVAYHATKLIVCDLAAAERFYKALGLREVSRNLGGEAEVRQEQVWLSASGDMTAHVLILSHFLEVPPPPPPVYPGEIWTCFQVSDVDATVVAAQAAGGKCLRAGEDRPEHSVRAAVVCDNEGHIIELVGPMAQA